ncbi:phosphoglucomutase-3 [Elysia marginata]|uniref:Phosphoglucomutase-3 n=1 Tax=Elysia marginata TaxID=1093978 RepID=A0AAV4IQ95_9GAST|nr:phosphoglucomutase-3 [Elysia marginata]
MSRFGSSTQHYQSINPVDERIDSYLDYLLKTYMHSFSSLFPLTVWASSGFNIKRTTNGCEAFHKQLNSMFYSAQPTMFELVDRLQDVIFESGFKMRGADDTARSKTATERKKAVWIEEINSLRMEPLIGKFISDALDALDCLQHVCRCYFM